MLRRGVVRQNRRIKPMQNLPMHQSPRCGAHSRGSGKPCRNGAMKNGRCRMHGGKATGAPKGNKNAWKHGNYSTQEKARRMLMRLLNQTQRVTVHIHGHAIALRVQREGDIIRWGRGRSAHLGRTYVASYKSYD